MQRLRKYIYGITFFASPKMRQDLDELSDEKRQTVSELVRMIINDYFERRKKQLRK